MINRMLLVIQIPDIRENDFIDFVVVAQTSSRQRSMKRYNVLSFDSRY